MALVFASSASDKRINTFLEILDIRGSQSDPDFVDLLGDGCASCVVFFFTFRDVRHVELCSAVTFGLFKTEKPQKYGLLTESRDG